MKTAYVDFVILGTTICQGTMRSRHSAGNSRNADGPMDYWLIQTGPDVQPGINGGMFRRMGPVGHVNTIDVPSVDEFAAKIVSHGGEIVLPKRAIPGVGWLAYAKDTEGSIFGIMQADKSAQ